MWGGTDVKSLFSFSGSLDSSVVPEPKPDTQHTLKHYINGGVEGRFPTISSDEVPNIVAPRRAPIFQDSTMRGGGLFYMRRPQQRLLVLLPF